MNKKSQSRSPYSLKTKIFNLSNPDSPTKALSSPYSILQSPKLNLSFLSKLQDEIRDKEINLIQALKKIKTLESEKQELESQVKDKNTQIQKLKEEILILKEKNNKPENKDLSDYWKREITKKSDELHKLQDFLQNFNFEENLQIDKDIQNLKEVFKQEKKIVENKLKTYTEKHTEDQKKIIELEYENAFLKRKIEEYDVDNVVNKYNELAKENIDIRQKLEIVSKNIDFCDVILVLPDIYLMSKQIHQLLIIMQNLKAGKDISLKLLLNHEERYDFNSSKQVFADVACMKRDLNLIKEIVSDYHAEHLGFEVCLTQ